MLIPNRMEKKITDSMSGMVQKFTREGEVLSAVGTNKDDVSFNTPHGIFLTDTTLFVVNRLDNLVSVFALQ